MPAPVIAWCGPLPIIGLFLLAGGRWMRYKYRVAIFVYVLSILTGFVFTVTQKVNDLGGALIAGIYAPIGYGVMFMALGLLGVIAEKRGLEPRFNVERYAFLKSMMGCSSIVVGAFAGGVMGLMIGGVLSLFVPPLIPLIDAFQEIALSEAEIDTLIETSVYLFGFTGLVGGAIAGRFWLFSPTKPFRQT